MFQNRKNWRYRIFFDTYPPHIAPYCQFDPPSPPLNWGRRLWMAPNAKPNSIFKIFEDKKEISENKMSTVKWLQLGMAIPRNISLLEESRNRGIEEWQFKIPRGSRKMNSIPRGPRGISRKVLLNNSSLYLKVIS